MNATFPKNATQRAFAKFIFDYTKEWENLNMYLHSTSFSNNAMFFRFDISRASLILFLRSCSFLIRSLKLNTVRVPNHLFVEQQPTLIRTEHSVFEVEAGGYIIIGSEVYSNIVTGCIAFCGEDHPAMEWRQKQKARVKHILSTLGSFEFSSLADGWRVVSQPDPNAYREAVKDLRRLLTDLGYQPL